MPDPRAKQILRRFEHLKARRSTWEAHWQEIVDYGLGRRDFNVRPDLSPGRKKLSKVFDNSFQVASERLAAGLHSLLTNPATKWFRLKLEADRLMEMDEVARWVEQAEARCYAAINSPAAGFAPIMHESYIDLVDFGTGGPFIEEGPRGPVFLMVPISGLYLGENAKGRLDTYMRCYQMDARQFVQEFGSGHSREIDQIAEGRDDPHDSFTVLHVVQPNTDQDVRNLGPMRFPFLSFHILVKDEKIVRTSGFNEDPYAIARWNKEPGEIYGRGPGIVALPDQKMLNEMGKTTLKAAQKRTDPPMAIAGDGVITQFQTHPGGVTVVNSAYMTGGKAPIQEFGNHGDIGIGIDMIRDRQAAVQAAFQWELLQLIRHIPGTTPMSATQTAEIADNQQRVLAPVLGRIQSEQGDKMIDRVFNIELRGGRLPPIPAILAGQNISVEYVSPAVRAQKSGEARAIRQWLTDAAGMSQVDPSVLHVVNSDAALRLIGEAEGVPLKVVNSPAVVEQMRAAERQVVQEQQALAEVSQLSEAAKNATPALQALEGGGGDAKAVA